MACGSSPLATNQANLNKFELFTKSITTVPAQSVHLYFMTHLHQDGDIVWPHNRCWFGTQPAEQPMTRTDVTRHLYWLCRLYRLVTTVWLSFNDTHQWTSSLSVMAVMMPFPMPF